MMDNEFEAAFSCFLERHEYDDAESVLFEIVRAAFLAGWRAVSARRRSGFFKFWAAPKKIPGINKKILISA
mgnify:CR=1 FL=1